MLAPHPSKGNLVVRFRGTGPATNRSSFWDIWMWSRPCAETGVRPFPTPEEKDGFFFGRGTLDTKGEEVVMVAAFLRMKQESFRSSRDLILALTADEEAGNRERRRLARPEPAWLGSTPRSASTPTAAAD